ncbi:MAG: PIG-L family deacetylase [Planctomycetales bacterium]|nr:PIG-L family deacetylase [Planctomycetales bacterium]
MLATKLDNVQSILCLGAHADDIEIGCGATLLQIVALRPDLRIKWVVFTSDSQRQVEAQASAEAILAGVAHASIEILQFSDRYLPWAGQQVKEKFFQLQETINPDLIFTHLLEDRHQDHRLLSELTWNTFRNHLIWEYEIPKYEGDLGHPNCYVSIPAKIGERKIDLLLEHFASQGNKSWFNRDTFRALMHIRGLESKSPSGLAEGFICRKALVQFD